MFDSSTAVGRRPKEGQWPQESSSEVDTILKKQRQQCAPQLTASLQCIFKSFVFYYSEQDDDQRWRVEKQRGAVYRRGCKSSSRYSNNCDNKADRNEAHSSKLWRGGDRSVQCCKAKKNIDQNLNVEPPQQQSFVSERGRSRL